MLSDDQVLLLEIYVESLGRQMSPRHQDIEQEKLEEACRSAHPLRTIVCALGSFSKRTAILTFDIHISAEM